MKRVPSQKQVRKVTRNNKHDRELAFDTGEQVLNDELLESLTTAGLAIGPNTLEPQMSEKKPTMSQSGKPIGGGKVSNSPVGKANTNMKELGQWPNRNPKNSGSAQETTGASHMRESQTPEQIAATLDDHGADLQRLFDNYAKNQTYICLSEFNEYASVYGLPQIQEQELLYLMQANKDLLFTEHEDTTGVYWTPALTENSPPDNAPPSPPQGGAATEPDMCNKCKKKPCKCPPWIKNSASEEFLDDGAPLLEFTTFAAPARPASLHTGLPARHTMPPGHMDSPMEDGPMTDDACPECGTPLDEIGCPKCGYTHPGEIESGIAEPGYCGAPMEDTLSEHDRVVMDGPDGKGVADRSGNGTDSGLPKEKTDMADMGKEWPRRQKNTGSAQADFGNSKHAEPNDGIMKHLMTMGLGEKQKNTGGQWEKLEGGGVGKMSGSTKKMYENIIKLSNHIKEALSESVRSSGLFNKRGHYPVAFTISAGELVTARTRPHLTEALADIEELLQFCEPEQVLLDASYFDNNGTLVMRREIALPTIARRGPIVVEGKILFRWPELARDYVDQLVSEGKACRAVTHNWGAAISANLSLQTASNVYSALREGYMQPAN